MSRYEVIYLPAERDRRLGYLGAPLTKIVEASSKEEAISLWQESNTQILQVREVRR